MKSLSLLSLPLVLLLMACQQVAVKSVEANRSQQKAGQEETAQEINKEEAAFWTPTEIEGCTAKVNVGEPFKFETSFNPYYLRADLDGNKTMDYAVLIKGQETQKRAVVICKDLEMPYAKEPFVVGSLAKTKTVHPSLIEDDNFITPEWAITTRKETKALEQYVGGPKIAADAKGEAVGFFFDGGSVFIYWDGKAFRVVTGG